MRGGDGGARTGPYAAAASDGGPCRWGSVPVAKGDSGRIGWGGPPSGGVPVAGAEPSSSESVHRRACRTGRRRWTRGPGVGVPRAPGRPRGAARGSRAGGRRRLRTRRISRLPLADLLFQAADGAQQVVEAALDGCQFVVHGHDLTSLPWAGAWAATFMRLRVLRVTPRLGRDVHAIGGEARRCVPWCAAPHGWASRPLPPCRRLLPNPFLFSGRIHAISSIYHQM